MNQNPTKFIESIKPMVSRLPKELTFSNEDERNIVLVSLEETGQGIEPILVKKSGPLSEILTEMLLKHSHTEIPDSFLPSIVGGSVNFPIQNDAEK
ncbi:hypothetical protein [Lysinibacillus fusiformis]